MATIKKYNGSTWENAVVRKYGTASDIITPPTTIYADGTAITTYTIKGNTVQNGTPTPSNPVDVNGVGERTENLFDKTTTKANTAISDSSGNEFGAQGLNASDWISVNGFSKITIPDTGSNRWGAFYTDSKVFILGFNGYGTKTIPQNAEYVRLTVPDAYLDSFMVVEGETLPTNYIPYGYKIPISSGGVTNNIYLSEPLMGIATADTIVSSGTVTRAYQIVELNSSMYIEAYNATWGTAFTISISNVSSGGEYATIDAVCSHYPKTTRNNIYRNNVNGICYSGSTNAIIINDVDCATVQDFKNFITAQKEANTPITIVIAVTTPTTETVTAPTIPTTDGANSITVDTTVQPSEFTATWTGWHDASVKEAKHGNNLFDYTTMSVSDENSYLNSDGTIGSSNDWNITEYIPCDGTSFTVGDIGGNTPAICLYNANKEYITGKSYNTGGIYTKQAVNITSQTIAKFIRFSYYKGSLNPDDISTIMLNSGSSLLPYEPYSIHWE